jgi:hypothetical protein
MRILCWQTREKGLATRLRLKMHRLQHEKAIGTKSNHGTLILGVGSYGRDTRAECAD